MPSQVCHVCDGSGGVEVYVNGAPAWRRYELTDCWMCDGNGYWG